MLEEGVKACFSFGRDIEELLPALSLPSTLEDLVDLAWTIRSELAFSLVDDYTAFHGASIAPGLAQSTGGSAADPMAVEGLVEEGAQGTAGPGSGEPTEDLSDHPDIVLLVQQAGCSREEAAKALRRENGDLVNAIMYLAREHMTSEGKAASQANVAATAGSNAAPFAPALGSVSGHVSGLGLTSRRRVVRQGHGVLCFLPGKQGEYVEEGGEVQSQAPPSLPLLLDQSHMGLTLGQKPCLIPLPYRFTELWSEVKSRFESKHPEDSEDQKRFEPALCLLTGRLLRAGYKPPDSDVAVGECTLHAQASGTGIGIFLLVERCSVLLMRDGHAAMARPFYVDSHGEDDQGLRRGRPLFLDAQRYQALEQLYATHRIASEVARLRMSNRGVLREYYF